MGLQQLLSDHPAELQCHAGPILEALAQRFADGDKGVRAALRALLRSTVLPGLGEGQLAPFLPVVMAHLASAMTHLAPDVRLDALGVLEALVEASPSLLAAGHLPTCLEHFSSQLSRAHRGRSVKSQALPPLLAALAALQRFLRRVLPATAQNQQQQQQQQQQEEEKQGAGDASTSTSYTTLRSCRTHWPPRSREPLTPATLLAHYTRPMAPTAPHTKDQPPSKRARLNSGASSSTSSGADAGLSGSAEQRAGMALLRQLFACWAECAPGSLAEAPELEAAQALGAILECANLLVAGLRLLGPEPMVGLQGG